MGAYYCLEDKALIMVKNNSTPHVERLALHQLFLRHTGECYRLAKRLSVTEPLITNWFKGRAESSRVESAILERAQILQQKEILDKHDVTFAAQARAA